MSTLTNVEMPKSVNDQLECILTKATELMAQHLKMNAGDIDPQKNITSYGLDSIDAVTILGDLEDWLDIELPSTLLWDYSNISDVSQYIVDSYDNLTIN